MLGAVGGTKKQPPPPVSTENVGGRQTARNTEHDRPTNPERDLDLQGVETFSKQLNWAMGSGSAEDIDGDDTVPGAALCCNALCRAPKQAPFFVRCAARLSKPHFAGAKKRACSLVACSCAVPRRAATCQGTRQGACQGARHGTCQGGTRREMSRGTRQGTCQGTHRGTCQGDAPRNVPVDMPGDVPGDASRNVRGGRATGRVTERPKGRASGRARGRTAGLARGTRHGTQ